MTAECGLSCCWSLPSKALWQRYTNMYVSCVGVLRVSESARTLTDAKHACADRLDLTSMPPSHFACLPCLSCPSGTQTHVTLALCSKQSQHRLSPQPVAPRNRNATRLTTRRNEIPNIPLKTLLAPRMRRVHANTNPRPPARNPDASLLPPAPTVTRNQMSQSTHARTHCLASPGTPRPEPSAPRASSLAPRAARSHPPSSVCSHACCVDPCAQLALHPLSLA